MNHVTPNQGRSQESNVNNWKDIDLSTPDGLHTLNRFIAKYRGYSVHKSDKTNYWYLLRPDETRAANYGTDWAAWLAVPRFSSDANVALALIPHVPFHLHNLPNGLWRASIVDGQTFEALAGTPALATCIVWLKWVDEETPDTAAGGQGAGE